MNKSAQRILILAVTVFGLSGLAEARQSSGEYGYERGHRNQIDRQSRFEDKIHQRQREHKRRIKQGEQKGKLTRWEKNELRREQRLIDRIIREHGADGHYTHWERSRINGEQNRAEQRIREFKHNRANARHHNNKKPRAGHQPYERRDNRHWRRDQPFFWLDL